MKSTFKNGLGLILLNTLFVFAAKAQEKEPATAQQIKEDRVPGLKYGPKKTEVPPQSSEKEKNYKQGDSKAYLFTDYRKPQQGLKQASKQTSTKTAAPAKLPSEAEPVQSKEKKAEIPKAPPMQNEESN
ncbi:hypothetical protein [Pedobacter nyackensis]|uniref:hypothetical protein n=1 Tax=Pedobacter nyackensis TaxID=475255 RepID=UPI00292EECC1|nr:hypothetical protein [Pedobacter nyackensis]